MTINHIDQLNEWWDAAEEADEISVGDLVIEDRRDREGGFDIWPARTTAIPLATESRRILSRAPKPKPAWHDAVAVIAHTARFSERRPFALTHTEDVLDPYNAEWITRDDLLNPVPLIEAKVTQSMIDRARVHASAYPINGDDLMRAFLTAALGLDPA